MSDLTNKQKKAYLRNFKKLGRKCPFCDSFNVNLGTFDPEEFRLDIECGNCGEEWHEQLEISSIEYEEPGEE